MNTKECINLAGLPHGKVNGKDLIPLVTGQGEATVLTDLLYGQGMKEAPRPDRQDMMQVVPHQDLQDIAVVHQGLHQDTMQVLNIALDILQKDRGMKEAHRRR